MLSAHSAQLPSAMIGRCHAERAVPYPSAAPKVRPINRALVTPGAFGASMGTIGRPFLHAALIHR